VYFLEVWRSESQVFGPDNFVTKENRFEKSGKYIHPLLAEMTTSGARLFSQKIIKLILGETSSF